MTTAAVAVTDLVLITAPTTLTVAKGQVAWERIKSTAAETRELWRQIGEALALGRAENPSNQAFGKWCAEHGFVFSANAGTNNAMRGNALWLFDNWSAVLGQTHNEHLTDPTAIRKAHRKAQRAAALPSDLQAIKPKPAATLEPSQARRVVKTLQRSESNDEGADIALKHLKSIAAKEGLDLSALIEAAKNGAPDDYYRFNPVLQLSIDNWRAKVTADVDSMEKAGISREAIRALFINLANSL